MKAAILDKYDKNGTTLAVRDVPTPKPAAHEVLVRIHTSAVNPLDNMIIRGDVRLIVPYRTPLVMGNEFSGTVAQVGTAAVKFKPGDRVYGRMPLAKIGAFAEYAAIDEGALALVPQLPLHGRGRLRAADRARRPAGAGHHGGTAWSDAVRLRGVRAALAPWRSPSPRAWASPWRPTAAPGTRSA